MPPTRRRHSRRRHTCRNRTGDVELTLPRLRATLAAAGHRPNARFHGKSPFVGWVDDGRGGTRVAGRFFPSRNAILCFRHRDAEIRQALQNHEEVHAMRYEHVCDGTADPRRRRCAYKGQHDAGFYRELEAHHRRTGVGPAAARAVEGDYAYPAHWKKAAWPS